MAQRRNPKTAQTKQRRDQASRDLAVCVVKEWGLVTHSQAHSDALQQNLVVSVGESELRACAGCGKDFAPCRPWQKQCTPRCRQRTYVERKAILPIGYYGT
jgi:hypothetical protein